MSKRSALLLVVLLLVQFLFPFAHNASAASLTDAEMRFYRLAANTAVNGTTARLLIKFTPASTATENEVRVTFDGNGTLGANSYGVDATASNITVSTTSLPTECTGVPTIGTEANAVSGAAVDFTSGDLTAATTYCFFITGGITSPQTADTQYVNTIETLSGSNAQVDTMDVTVYHTSDQVTVSAVVPSTFTFDLGATSTSFTTDLAIGSVVSTTGVTGTITTNAGNGWTAYLRSANAGLDSAVTGDTIDTVGSIDNSITDLDPTYTSPAGESYTLLVEETADAESNGSPDAEYNDGSPASDEGGTFNGTDLEAIASGTGATSNYVFTMTGKATIAATTQAANDYTDTWTVVAAGNF